MVIGNYKRKGLRELPPDAWRSGRNRVRASQDRSNAGGRPKSREKRLPIGEKSMFGEARSIMALPPTARRMHGCVNCEWRGTNLCPYGFKRGTGKRLRENMHAEGICLERVNYLLSFTEEPPEGKKVTYQQWRQDFNLGIAQVQQMDDYRLLWEKQAELDALPADGDDGERKRLKAEKDQLRKEWRELWKDLVNVGEVAIARTTPKVIELTERKTFSLSDIHTAMRMARVIDVEGHVDDAQIEDKTEDGAVQDDNNQ